MSNSSPNEELDPIYKYVDQYIGKKLKLIKRELQQLKIAHDAIAKQQQDQLLLTQRLTSDFMVGCIGQVYRIVLTQKPIKNMITQLAVDASKAKAEIRTSEIPLTIVRNFVTKWEQNLKSIGISSTRL